MNIVAKYAEFAEPKHSEMLRYYDGELKTIDIDFEIEEDITLHFIVFRDDKTVLFTQINDKIATCGNYYNACHETKYPYIDDFVESKDFKDIMRRLIGTEEMTVKYYALGTDYRTAYISGKANNKSSVVG